MDDIVRGLRSSARAEGQQRIFIHGEKEWEKTDERVRLGIPLHPKVVADLRSLGEELDVACPF